MDFGCGTGALVHRLRSAGVEADGVDSSPGMLELARKGPGAFLLADAASAPIPESSYDLCLTVGVLHYLLEPDRVAAFLRRMAFSTRPGGRILVWDNNPLNWYWNPLMSRLSVDQVPTRLLGLDEIAGRLEGAGARIVSVRHLGWVPDFTPKGLLSAVAALERILERTPLVNRFSAYNVVVAEKT